jgi:thiamine-monophosphate kinase
VAGSRSSEFDLIARIRERLPDTGPRLRVGSGDDAAVTEPETAAATTIDALVEGVHFTLPEFPLIAVGRKAMAAGLSDLAAMGAEPGEAYVAVGAPGSMDDDALMELTDGIAELAERSGTAVAGGDLTAAPVLMVVVTCVGYERPGVRLVSRAGAKPGDAVVVTGELGGAAAGLRLLREEAEAAGLDPGIRRALVDRQLDPQPRLESGRMLAAAGATAMIDVSDGLAQDASHVAAASGSRLEVELDRVPVAGGVEAAAGGDPEARRLALSGGEDYELLATVPADAVDAAHSSLEEAGYPLTQIGSVTDGTGAAFLDAEGNELPADDPELAGFDHRRGSLSG